MSADYWCKPLIGYPLGLITGAAAANRRPQSTLWLCDNRGSHIRSAFDSKCRCEVRRHWRPGQTKSRGDRKQTGTAAIATEQQFQSSTFVAMSVA